MATAASRREGERLDLLAEIARHYMEQERDMRTVELLAARMRKRTRLQAVFVSRACGATVVALGQVSEGPLPYASDRTLR